MRPLDFALKEYAQKEIAGEKNNPRILEYYKLARNSWVKSESVAWCSAFLCYCLEMAGIHSTRSLTARSYERWGKPTPDPKVGDIAVFWRQSKRSGLGHVGFYITQNEHFIYVLGGNQSDQVSIAPYPKSQLLSFRKVPVTDWQKQNQLLRNLFIKYFNKRV